ncbi:MAG: hypothetical protein ACR2PU_00650 [Gammaproteobacteria bacterium]
MLCCFGLFLILVLYGCGSKCIAEGGLSVLAEIRDPQGKQLNSCKIELQNQDRKILEGSDSIPGKFHKVFIVAPHRANYLVNISCPGFKTYQTLAKYGESVTPLRPLRLGVITMEPAQQ